MLKRLFINMAILLALTNIANSQVVTSSLALPTDTDQIVITYYATLGESELMDLALNDTIYAHIGVITDMSISDKNWKYPKAQWAINIPECKLTRLSTNRYTLAISPSIREYFGVPIGEEIKKVAIVFNNIDCSKTGKDVGGLDIFIPVKALGIDCNAK